MKKWAKKFVIFMVLLNVTLGYALKAVGILGPGPLVIILALLLVPALVQVPALFM